MRLVRPVLRAPIPNLGHGLMAVNLSFVVGFSPEKRQSFGGGMVRGFSGGGEMLVLNRQDNARAVDPRWELTGTDGPLIRRISGNG